MDDIYLDIRVLSTVKSLRFTTFALSYFFMCHALMRRVPSWTIAKHSCIIPQSHCLETMAPRHPELPNTKDLINAFLSAPRHRIQSTFAHSPALLVQHCSMHKTSCSSDTNSQMPPPAPLTCPTAHAHYERRIPLFPLTTNCNPYIYPPPKITSGISQKFMKSYRLS